MLEGGEQTIPGLDSRGGECFKKRRALQTSNQRCGRREDRFPNWLAAALRLRWSVSEERSVREGSRQRVGGAHENWVKPVQYNADVVLSVSEEEAINRPCVR